MSWGDWHDRAKATYVEQRFLEEQLYLSPLHDVQI